MGTGPSVHSFGSMYLSLVVLFKGFWEFWLEIKNGSLFPYPPISLTLTYLQIPPMLNC